MAAFQLIIPEGNYENDAAVERVIEYVCRLNKPKQIGGLGVYPLQPEYMICQFKAVKNYYGKIAGKQIFHLIISFDKSLNFSIEEIVEMGYAIAAYWGAERQVVFAVHDDTLNKHIHIVINSVAYTNGAYKAFYALDEIRDYIDSVVQAEIDRKWFGK